MSEGIRRWTTVIAGCLLGGLLVAAFTGLPAFGTFEGHYGQLLVRQAPEARGVANVVTGVVFDYRSLDTLIEELILLTAVAGVALLLRKTGEERSEAPEEAVSGRTAPATSALVRLVGLLFVGLDVLYGFHLAAHGHLSPGGGFQGGVVLASAFVLVYLVTDFGIFERLASRTLLEAVEAVSVGAFVLAGAVGLVWTGSYLLDVLPDGRVGRLLSGGHIFPLGLLVAFAVGAGIVLLLTEFLVQALIQREE